MTRWVGSPGISPGSGEANLSLLSLSSSQSQLWQQPPSRRPEQRRQGGSNVSCVGGGTGRTRSRSCTTEPPAGWSSASRVWQRCTRGPGTGDRLGDQTLCWRKFSLTRYSISKSWVSLNLFPLFQCGSGYGFGCESVFRSRVLTSKKWKKFTA